MRASRELLARPASPQHGPSNGAQIPALRATGSVPELWRRIEPTGSRKSHRDEQGVPEFSSTHAWRIGGLRASPSRITLRSNLILSQGMRGVSCSKGQSHSCRNLRLETIDTPADETNRSSANPVAQSYPRAQSVIRQALSLSVGELLQTLKMPSLMASPLHFPRWGFLSTPEGCA